MSKEFSKDGEEVLAKLDAGSLPDGVGRYNNHLWGLSWWDRIESLFYPPRAIRTSPHFHPRNVLAWGLTLSVALEAGVGFLLVSSQIPSSEVPFQAITGVLASFFAGAVLEVARVRFIADRPQ